MLRILPLSPGTHVPLPLRRPSGIPEKDLCSVMAPYFLKQQETLCRQVRKQEAKNQELANAVLAGRRQVEELQRQVQALQQTWQASVWPGGFLLSQPPWVGASSLGVGCAHSGEHAVPGWDVGGWLLGACAGQSRHTFRGAKWVWAERAGAWTSVQAGPTLCAGCSSCCVQVLSGAVNSVHP